MECTTNELAFLLPFCYQKKILFRTGGWADPGGGGGG